MTKRIALLVYAVASVLSSNVFAQEQQGLPLVPGRFQVLDATFSGPPGTVPKQFKRLVILDTATGALTLCDYMYQDAGKDKNQREYWLSNGTCGPFVSPQAMLIPKSTGKK